MVDTSARRFLWLFVAASLAGGTIITALNIAVNPLAYYATTLVRPLTWSSRHTKTQQMAALKPASALILGSSRSMLIAPSEVEQLTGLRCYNACVDSAFAEDYVAFFRYATEELHWPLQEVVLGVDVEAFHASSGPDLRNSPTSAVFRYLPWDFRAQIFAALAGALLDYGQTVSSLRSLAFLVRGFPADSSRFDADGLLHYIQWERDIAAGTFRPDIDGQITAYERRFARFEHLSARRLQVFKDWIHTGMTRGVRFRVFITPLHARVLDALRARFPFDRLRSELVEVLQSMAGMYGQAFQFLDFTEVNAFGGDPDLFYDGAHTREENSRRMLRALYGDTNAHALQ